MIRSNCIKNIKAVIGLLLTICITLACFDSNIALGNTNGNGLISGHVSGKVGGVPLPYAQIHIVDNANSTVSDQGGFFMLRNISPGDHTLQISYVGYKTYTASASVASGQIVEVKIVLETLLDPNMGGDLLELNNGLAKTYMDQSTSISHKYALSGEQMSLHGDLSLAESLMRMPGVNTDYSFGVPTGILIRGLDMNKNLVQLNGVTLPPTITGNRGTNLDFFSDKILSSVEIIRVPTADMSADALGGIINIKTDHPMPDRPLLSVYASGEYGSYSHSIRPRGAIAYSQGFGKFGLSLQGEYRKAYYEENGIQLQWRGSGDNPTINEALAGLYTKEAENYGFSGRFNFQANNQTNFFVSGLYQNKNDDFFQEEYLFSTAGASITQQNNLFAAENGLAGNMPRMTNGSSFLYSVTTGGQHSARAFDVDFSLTLMGSKSQTDFDRSLVWRNNSSNILVDNNDYHLPEFSFSDGNAYNPDMYYFFNTIDKTDNVDRTGYVGSINFLLPLKVGQKMHVDIKFGGQYSQLKKERNALQFVYDNPIPQNISMSGFASLRDWFVVGSPNLKNGPGFSFSDWGVWFDDNKNQLNYRQDRSNESQLKNNKLNETVIASYLMSTLKIGQTTINTGLRVENTKGRYEGWSGARRSVVEFDLLGTLREDVSYTNLFPSLHIRHDFSSRAIFRVGVAYGMKRPSFTDVIPSKEYNYVTRRIYEGNPNLDPMKVIRGQLSVEYYFQSIGQVSVAFFFNEYKDFIYLREVIDWNPEFAGWRNISPQNGELTQYFGSEVTWQKTLDFLPGMLERLSVYSNLTYIVSRKSVEQPFIRTIQNPNLRPLDMNVGLSYDYRGFKSLVIVKYSPEYLTAANTHRFQSAVMDQYQSDALSIGVLLQQRITRNILCTVNVKNVLNTSYSNRYSIVGDPGDPYFKSEIPRFTSTFSENAWYGVLGLRVDL